MLPNPFAPLPPPPPGDPVPLSPKGWLLIFALCVLMIGEMYYFLHTP